MKLAFSTSICPDFNLDALIDKARGWGYDGIEVAQPEARGGSALGESLRAHAGTVRQKLQDAGVQLSALDAGRFVPPTGPAANGRAANLRESLELAEALGCGLVVLRPGPLWPGADKLRLLHAYARALEAAAAEAAGRGIALAVENLGVLALSQDLWHVRDAAGAPALRFCFNPLSSRLAGDSPSLAVKRLGAALALVHLADARLGGDGAPQYVAPGSGELNLPYILELLKGLAYPGWVCLRWPAGALTSAPVEELLAAGAEFLRAERDKPRVELTAYKGDDKLPRYATRQPH